MAHYLVQVSYTAEAFATMTLNPENRWEAVRPVVERLGGLIVFKGFAFGDYDLVAIIELPEQQGPDALPPNVRAAAFAMAVSAGGAVKAFKTTPLLSMDEAMKAMRRAGRSGYLAPGIRPGDAKGT